MKVEVKKIYLENYKKFPSKSVDLFPRTAHVECVCLLETAER